MKCYHCDKEWPEAKGPAGVDNTLPVRDTREPFICPGCKETTEEPLVFLDAPDGAHSQMIVSYYDMMDRVLQQLTDASMLGCRPPGSETLSPAAVTKEMWAAAMAGYMERNPPTTDPEWAKSTTKWTLAQDGEWQAREPGCKCMVAEGASHPIGSAHHAACPAFKPRAHP